MGGAAIPHDDLPTPGGADGRNLVGEKDIEAGMRQAVQDYGMNIDLIIVFNNDATLFWEAES